MNLQYFYRWLAKKFPELEGKLAQAGKKEPVTDFLKQIVTTSILVAASIFIFLSAFLLRFDRPIFVAVIAAIITGFVGFLYLTKLPDMIIIRNNKDVEREIVYAGKFLIVELNAGVTLYDGLKTVAFNYEGVGKQLRTVINEIDLGTSMDEALNNAINRTGSQHFRKFLWQILYAQQTGSDVGASLSTVLDQILREQQIEVEKYGKKLNPVAMFYLMIAVVIPSLGMIMLIIVASFVNFQLSFWVLMLIAFAFVVVQYMFVAVIKSMRPAIDL